MALVALRWLCDIASIFLLHICIFQTKVIIFKILLHGHYVLYPNCCLCWLVKWVPVYSFWTISGGKIFRRLVSNKNRKERGQTGEISKKVFLKAYLIRNLPPCYRLQQGWCLCLWEVPQRTLEGRNGRWLWECQGSAYLRWNRYGKPAVSNQGSGGQSDVLRSQSGFR